MGFSSWASTMWANGVEALVAGGATAALRPAKRETTAIPKHGREERRLRIHTRWTGLAVFALLALYATMAWTASLGKGQSFDEGLQLAVGYNIWLNDDFRIEGANGDLVKRWATLPYLISRPRFVGPEDKFLQAAAPYEVAHRFFFQLGNKPEMLLSQARAMVVLLGVATGLLVFFWARELFGAGGGLVALALFAFSPHMLAFGGIVSTDMSITLTLFASTWCIWRLLHRVTPARTLVSLGVFGLLVLAKPTALVILPVMAVLVATKLLARTPLFVRVGSQEWVLVRRRAQLVVIAAMVCAHALAGWTAIWAHYGFRYEASPRPDDAHYGMMKLPYRDEVAEPLRRTLRWLQETRLLPEGFHRGVHLLVGNDDETVSFMNGTWSIGGRPEFFPYAMWAKTSPFLWLLLAGAGVMWWRARRRRNACELDEEETHDSAGSLYAAAPLLALIGCYLAIAISDELNIGHRHILPIYPAIYVVAGAVVLGVARGRERVIKRCLIAGALMGVAAESMALRPDYLAYFSPFVGGPEAGYRRLVDSSLDWGMDLPALREWLAREDPTGGTPVFLAYFGTDNPKHHGIRAWRLPGFFDRRPVEPYPLAPGYYAISATLLQSLYTPAFGAWSKAYEERYQLAAQRMALFERSDEEVRKQWKPEERQFWLTELHNYDALRFGRLCAWLRNRRPPEHEVGHSILIWKLSLEDLRVALLGPPVELTDDPMPTRHYGRTTPLRE